MAAGKSGKRKAEGRKPQHPAKTWQQMFLDELRNCGNVRAACAKARVERSTVYKEKRGNDEFAAAWKDALDDALDSLEAEAWHRAEKGDPKYVLYRGKPVKIGKKYLIEREKSDALMALLLKAHRPERFRERADALNLNLDLSMLTDEQLERISNGEDPRAVLATSSASGTDPTATQTEHEPGAAALDAASAEPTAAAGV